MSTYWPLHTRAHKFTDTCTLVCPSHVNMCVHTLTHTTYIHILKKSAEKSVGLVIVLILCNIFLKRYTYVTFAFMYG